MDPDKIVLGKTYHCVVGRDNDTTDLTEDVSAYTITFTPNSRVEHGLYAAQDGFDGIDGDGHQGIVFAKEFLAEV